MTFNFSHTHTQCIYILVMWQMLLTKGLVLYGAHIFRGGRYQDNKRQQGREKTQRREKQDLMRREKKRPAVEIFWIKSGTAINSRSVSRL